jgi:hypothetical protein
MRKLVLSFAIAAFALAIGPPAVAASPSYDCVASARSDTTTPNLVAVQATDAAIAVNPNTEQAPPLTYFAALVFAGSGAMYDHRSHVDLSSPTIDYS